jgi:hypothetical protein
LLIEPVSKCPILFKVKEDENFNHRHTYSIPRIEALRPKGGLPGKEVIHFIKAPLDPPKGRGCGEHPGKI